MALTMLSVIVPLYNNEENLPRLFSELERISSLASFPMELVFVNDGSPDQCGRIVAQKLPHLRFRAQLLNLSRNFGAFAAIAAGLKHAGGEYFAVLAADLQEPPEIVLRFAEQLDAGTVDIVFAQRGQRSDPFFARVCSNFFWTVYRRLVNAQIPAGGVDVFGCNRQVRDQICSMKEVETSLVALLFWMGFRQGFVTYDRRTRLEGKSAWTLSKKIQYLINSVFNFTDLPIRLLLLLGAAGMLLSVIGATMVVAAKLTGNIPVPGYSAIAILVLFFGGLTTAGLGIIGQYTWLCLQNARSRPPFIVRDVHAVDRSEEIQQ